MSDMSLPPGWIEQPISSLLAKLESGVSVNAEDRACGADEIGVLKTSCVNGGRFNPRENKVVRDRLEIRRAELNPRKDSILISRMNTFDLVGESAYVDEDYSNLFVPDRLWQTVMRKDVATCVKWLSYVARSPVFRHSVSNAATGTSGSMKNISQPSYLAIRARVPPLPEQRKIARILTTLDNLIEKMENLIAKDRAIKQGMMHDLFTRGVDAHGHLRPTRAEAPDLYKESELGWIPKEWEVVQCAEICREIVVGIVIQPAQYYQVEGVPVLRSANVHEDGMNCSELVFMSEQSNQILAKSQIHEGDVVTVRTGYPGTSCVVPREFDGANCVDILISRVGPRVKPHFLAIWINSEGGKNQVLRKQGGLAQQHFNVGELKDLLVALPPVSEQERILLVLSSQNELMTSESANREKMKLVKTGLMQNLLTGKVRVKVDEAEEIAAHV